ncbi:MAG TPA: DUF2470 domain-containing protein [Crinalium sp.]|jgi:putative heme iron utilization protein
MTDPFSPEVSDRICKHMNDDHAEAIALYAKAFGGVAEAIAAKMIKIDAQGMDLSVEANGSVNPVRVQFDHTLKDAEDAHHTLVDMVKEARKKM